MTHSIDEQPVAVITGASRGLGLALTTALVGRGWRVVVTARDAVHLANALADLPQRQIVRVPGDVADAEHRQRLAQAAADAGGARLLVNNASVLGPSPSLPGSALSGITLDDLRRVYAVNTVGPLMLIQQLLPQLREQHGRIVNISSDAASEAYEGWGSYASSKAALDHLSRTLAAEQPELRVYAADPGDMNTAMHQEAFPGEDISDRPDPVTAVPGLLRLVDGDLPSGRYRAAELAAEAVRA